MRITVLALVAIALAVPATTSIAAASPTDTPQGVVQSGPGIPTPTASATCDVGPCADPQATNSEIRPTGHTNAPGQTDSLLPPAENEHLADFFLVALLGILIVMIPVVAVRTRGQDGPTPTPRLKLIWSRNGGVTPTTAVAESRQSADGPLTEDEQRHPRAV